jgi:hypothetical protein
MVLTLATLAMIATASAPSPLYPLYRERWGFSITTLTVIFAVYVVGLPRRADAVWFDITDQRSAPVVEVHELKVAKRDLVSRRSRDLKTSRASVIQ